MYISYSEPIVFLLQVDVKLEYGVGQWCLKKRESTP